MWQPLGPNPNNSKKVKDLLCLKFSLNVTHKQTVYSCFVPVLEGMKHESLRAVSGSDPGNDTVFDSWNKPRRDTYTNFLPELK